ncbi:E3 ubiquitin-protein ligase RBBP6-like isoform X2 [Littorina saxatilis]|uniref:E3 ubiquitin-protein ligase RBBP6-like isoform X2 n=1 Tax=Littorina saxatilis TaxID=31220 RepID=UPI0038B61BD9
MDEGRLGMAIRSEERHRKSVYMMNDMIRSQFSLYNSCLSQEQHESSIKLVKNCVEMRRTVVRQKVLRKCLEMRKRKILVRDPSRRYGQYGGVPLWAMSRDIERVIADNHPKIRRMKRVQEAMQKSRDSGAILDADTVARRIETFFQLQQRRQQRDRSPERVQPPKGVFEVTSTPLRRHNDVKLPSITTAQADAHKGGVVVAESSSPLTGQRSETSRPKPKAALQEASRKDKIRISADTSRSKDVEGSESSSRRSSLEERGDGKAGGVSEDSKTLRVGSDGIRAGSKPSLNLDSKGRLRGIRTSIDTIHEDEAHGEENQEGISVESGVVGEPAVERKNESDGIEEVVAANTAGRKPVKQHSSESGKNRESRPVERRKASDGIEEVVAANTAGRKPLKQHSGERDHTSPDSVRRSQPILPPIKPGKGLVARE